jgi:hypothetical protein
MHNLHTLALSLKATDWAIIGSAVASAVVAVFTIVLAFVGRRQIADTRILQRAYLSVEPRGIEWTTNGSLDDRFHEPDHGTGDLLVDSSFAVR